MPLDRFLFDSCRIRDREFIASYISSFEHEAIEDVMSLIEDDGIVSVEGLMNVGIEKVGHAMRILFEMEKIRMGLGVGMDSGEEAAIVQENPTNQREGW